ncbi:gfo/Idh/MocA family oxidoreductase [Microbacterium sp. W1N]|uniref:gfo/Idh/MocA family oxidoreductase n=1 Tax=Microbacterium festucae TaxID=2977531 RepID=UPI0021C1009E|nr:gfo/Idh/MocA family oxidoreductase [Microbacterium festucae]MCT9819334.1 gfo/Idh/MocA family oxidoreductase [Microbacterium festucae]
MTTDAAPLRFGLIGVDQSHATQFADLLGDGRSGRVPGALVAAAWQAPTSEDFPPSRDRNAAQAAALGERGVPLLDTPEAVAAASDVLLILTSDARTHPALLGRVSVLGKPVFVNTRFALTGIAAREALATARAHGCLVLSASPKRFTPAFQATIRAVAAPREVRLEGPLPEQPHHPFLAWYGVHLVDLAVTALGPGWTVVDATGPGVRITWSDARCATLRGDDEWGPLTRGVVRGPDGERAFDIEVGPDLHVGLLEAIIRAVHMGRPWNTDAEILAIVGIVEAAALSRERGEPVVRAVDDVGAWSC